MEKETSFKNKEKALLKTEIKGFKVTLVVSEDPDTKVDLVDMVNFYARKQFV